MWSIWKCYTSAVAVKNNNELSLAWEIAQLGVRANVTRTWEDSWHLYCWRSKLNMSTCSRLATSPPGVWQSIVTRCLPTPSAPLHHSPSGWGSKEEGQAPLTGKNFCLFVRPFTLRNLKQCSWQIQFTWRKMFKDGQRLYVPFCHLVRLNTWVLDVLLMPGWKGINGLHPYCLKTESRGKLAV